MDGIATPNRGEMPPVVEAMQVGSDYNGDVNIVRLRMVSGLLIEGAVIDLLTAHQLLGELG